MSVNKPDSLKEVVHTDKNIILESGNSENNTVIKSTQINVDNSSDVVIGSVVDIRSPATIYRTVSTVSSQDTCQSTDFISESSTLNIVLRSEWLAKPPTQPLDELQLPVQYVIIQHTATESCFDQESCSNHIRIIQSFHMESRKWWDIAYNFLVGGNGQVYEGRGWNKLGAHTYGYNSKSIGIALIGTFINTKPTEEQISAAKKLINLGVEKGFIGQDYKLLAANQVSNTLSPGEELYQDMKTWPHWAPKP